MGTEMGELMLRRLGGEEEEDEEKDEGLMLREEPRRERRLVALSLSPPLTFSPPLSFSPLSFSFSFSFGGLVQLIISGMLRWRQGSAGRGGARRGGGGRGGGVRVTTSGGQTLSLFPGSLLSSMSSVGPSSLGRWGLWL